MNKELLFFSANFECTAMRHGIVVAFVVTGNGRIEKPTTRTIAPSEKPNNHDSKMCGYILYDGAAQRYGMAWRLCMWCL